MTSTSPGDIFILNREKMKRTAKEFEQTIGSLETEMCEMRKEIKELRNLVIALKSQVDRGPDPRLWGPEIGVRY